MITQCKNQYLLDGLLIRLSVENYFEFNRLIDVEKNVMANILSRQVPKVQDDLEKIKSINGQKTNFIKNFYDNDCFRMALEIFNKAKIGRRKLRTLDQPPVTFSNFIFNSDSIFILCVMGCLFQTVVVAQRGALPYTLGYEKTIEKLQHKLKNQIIRSTIPDHFKPHAASHCSQSIYDDMQFQFEINKFINVQRAGETTITKIAIRMFGMYLGNYFDVTEKNISKLVSASANIANIFCSDGAPEDKRILEYLKPAIVRAAAF